MFLGHFGVALAAKRAAPRTSLASLFAAAAFVDVIWPLFLLLGWESARVVPGITVVTPIDFSSYPISHSLLTGIAWGGLFGGVYWLLRRYSRGAVVLGLLVLSHWLLDLVVHRPDLPLYPGGNARLGLGLWNSLPGTLAVETALFTAGVWIYLACTQPRDRIGTFAPWGLFALLALSFAANLMSTPPENLQTLAYAAFAGTAITLLLAWWVDRHRQAKPAALSRSHSG